MLSLPYPSPCHQNSSITVDYNGKSCKTRTLLKKQFLGKPKDSRRKQNKNVFDGLISKLDRAKEGISDRENMSMETSQIQR